MPLFPQAPTTRNKITQLGHSHPFNQPPTVTHHPKPPKDTLRFLLNMVAAAGAPGPSNVPRAVVKGTSCSAAGSAPGV